MRAQIAGQVFVYVLAIVLISIILLFGYRAIDNFRERTEIIAYTDMKNDMVNAVKSISIDYNSVKKEEINVPGGYKGVCFIRSFDEGAFSMGDGLGSDSTTYPIIDQSMQAGIKNNVFLIATDNSQEKPFDIGTIAFSEQDKKILCLQVKYGKIIFKLKGKGDYVEIFE